ncbi:hypothetical protein ABPG72_022783 [Tetrahymena utriculariae]
MIVDDYNELLCLMCNELFDDTGDKLPRMLPQCGHSVCSQCIQDKLSANQQIICPEDQEPQNRNELIQFPKNFSLIRMIQKKKKIQSQMKQQAGLMSSTTVNTENDRYSENFTPIKTITSEESDRNSNVHISSFDDKSCQDHFKKLDIVCVDCRIKICASCALFGKHKGHLVRSEEDVLKEISTRAEYLLQMFENIEKKQCYLTDENHIQTVKDYLQSNLKNVLQEIQIKFTEIENKLQQKKEESIKEVKERFSEMEKKCLNFLTEAPKDAIEMTEKWKIDAKNRLLVLCEQNNTENYSLDLMLDQRMENQNDIINQGQELLKLIEQANQNLEKQLEEFQFETVYVDFAHNYRTFFDKLISVSSRQDNELSNLLHTKKFLFQKPFSQSELSLARQSIDVFNEKIDRKTSDKESEYKLIDGELHRISGGGADILDSPQIKGKQKMGNGNGNMNNGSLNGHHFSSRNQQVQNINGLSANQNHANTSQFHQQNNQNGIQTISTKKTHSIFNNDLLDDNLLLNNDDINEQFNDSVLMMTKQSSKFNSPNFFNKVNVEEFMVTSSLGKSHLSEPQLLEGIDQELFGKNIELPNNIDVQIKDHNDPHQHQAGSATQKLINLGESILNKIQIDSQKERNSDQKGKGLNEKFISILNEVNKDTIEQADFTYADMGDEGILKICEALKQNQHLKSLKLQRNKISDKGAQCLIENIIKNSSNISTLYLQDNMISDKFLDLVLQKFQNVNQNKKKLENVYLKNNLLNVNKTQKVIEELKKLSINIYI